MAQQGKLLWRIADLAKSTGVACFNFCIKSFWGVLSFLISLVYDLYRRCVEGCFATLHSVKRAWFRTGQLLYDDVYLLGCEIITDVLPHWFSTGIDSISPRFIKQKQLKASLATAASYEDWVASAKSIDRLLSNDAWKMSYECEVSSQRFEYLVV